MTVKELRERLWDFDDCLPVVFKSSSSRLVADVKFADLPEHEQFVMLTNETHDPGDERVS